MTRLEGLVAVVLGSIAVAHAQTIKSGGKTVGMCLVPNLSASTPRFND